MTAATAGCGSVTRRLLHRLPADAARIIRRSLKEGWVARYDVISDRDLLVVVVVGEVDLADADVFEAALRSAVQAGVVIVDAFRLTFIDSAGMRALYRVSIDGSHVRVRNAPPVLRSLVDLAGVAHLIELV
jgi:anti-anti-sigma factor